MRGLYLNRRCILKVDLELPGQPEQREFPNCFKSARDDIRFGFVSTNHTFMNITFSKKYLPGLLG
jgi:hypothetical protein|tara:strand:- start:131 stop:325 length:195 start_codon:yes stop_codon:yes gene_type:complete